MDQSSSPINKHWCNPFTWFTRKTVGQSKNQTINHLVVFHFSSLILAVSAAIIQVWEIPTKLGISGVSKDILSPLIVLVGSVLSYSLIRDVITAEFDAGVETIKNELNKQHKDEMQKTLDQIDGLNKQHKDEMQKTRDQINGLDIKYALDFKYLAYIKPSLSPRELQLQDISLVLRDEYLEDANAFESKLNTKLESNKTTREASYIIAHLPDTFLHQIAVEGIARALDSEFDDVIEQTYLGNKLYPLRTDISVYLTAWLICSIDNDMGEPMPIDYIGMRYTGEGNVPSKEIYKKVIRAIVKIIAEGEYKVSKYYPDDDPLSSESVRNKINDCLKQLINLIEKYPSEEVEF
jgi:hypothetical protein